MTLLDRAQDMVADLVRLRHALHREPEIGLDLPRTQEKVLAALDGLPLEIITGRGASSVTAVLRGTTASAGTPTSGRPGQQPPAGTGPQPDTGPQPGPGPEPEPDGGARAAVLLRGDMDALPVGERTEWEHASRFDGVMHACGHDLHTAMLVGAAHLLCAHRDRLAGDVVFMFQPGEEGWEGAQLMIDEGVLDASGRRVAAAYALHVFSALVPRRRFATRPGPMTASSASLLVTVRGEGGHGSMPHRARDPIIAAAEMIGALPAMITRQFDALDPVVVNVGVVQAGTRRTIIPDSARFEATVRCFSPATQERVGRAAHRLLRGIADGHGVEVDVDFVPERPVTMNDPVETTFAAETAAETFGTDRSALLTHPLACSEDFSRVLRLVPGALLALGAAPDGVDPVNAAFNHSPRARFDDAVLADGAALYAELASRRLAR